MLFLLLWCPLLAQAQATSAEELTEHRKLLVAQLLSNPRAPLDSASIFGLRYFSPNDSFRFSTVILPLVDSAEVSFATSDGNAKQYLPYAKVYFVHAGAMQQLTVYESVALRQNPLYRDQLFVPFWDETNGFESYGGGRYLSVSKQAVDARNLELDFNKAYNPWCAYGEGFSCPIPPPNNRLDILVNAGEAAFVKPPHP